MTKEEILEELKKNRRYISERRQEEIDKGTFIPYDWFGGNADDCYEAGGDDGWNEATDFFISLLEQLT